MDVAQKGDKICLLLGFCTPFIIRDEGPNFTLAEGSYVHGVMDGLRFEISPRMPRLKKIDFPSLHSWSPAASPPEGDLTYKVVMRISMFTR